MKPANALSWRQLCWLFALALSLLASQFVGQRHRIDHSVWLANGAQLSERPSGWAVGSEATHSCIALDAACLADLLTDAQHPTAPRAFTSPSPLPLPGAIWAPFFSTYFHSRAPPLTP